MQSDPAPIACTLGPSEFRERVEWLRELSDEALLSYDLKDLELTLAYNSAHAQRVMEFVRRERSCCGFLEFAISASDDGISVHVRAPEAARSIARDLFQDFIGAARAE